MRYLDIDNWDRKQHFKHFTAIDYPQFNVCANLDISKYYKYIKKNHYPFFISVLFASVVTANKIKEFKYRIRGNRVVEHDYVHPSYTIMGKNGVFSFCHSKYAEKFSDFNQRITADIELVKENVTLDDEPGKDDLLFITSLPWISFTSISHPINMKKDDSIPRIAWGKYFEENEKMKIPISVQAHHALIDGAHIGEYFRLLQEAFDNPEKYLEN